MPDLDAWLSYADRASAFNATVGNTVLSDAFVYRSEGDTRRVGWRAEEWWIRSLLVPLATPDEVLATLGPSDDLFRLGWSSDGAFAFGDGREVDGWTIRPWSFAFKDTVADELRVELRDDFRRYHMLEARSSGEFWHPIERVRVAAVSVETHSFYNPSGRVEVTRRYLLDYLAARGWALVVVQVSDRFAAVSSTTELSVNAHDEVALEPRVTARLTIQPLSRGSEAVQARACLWRYFVIAPHAPPVYSTSPWPYVGEYPASERQSPVYAFTADGQVGTLSDAACPPYLYFDRSVLGRYITDPVLRVRFHMRTWGAAAGPGEIGGVDAGINRQGLVTAFAPDLRRLPPWLQQHWASHSRAPAGEVCEELFQTRMQNAPPDSPSLVASLGSGRTALNQAFDATYGCHLFANSVGTADGHLTVGPVSTSDAELLQLCKALYQLLVEPISTECLRHALGEGNYEPEWRQIKLLEALLPDTSAFPRLLGGLNALRIGDAHATSVDISESYSRMGLPDDGDVRSRYLVLVDALAAALHDAAAAVASV